MTVNAVGPGTFTERVCECSATFYRAAIDDRMDCLTCRGKERILAQRRRRNERQRAARVAERAAGGTPYCDDCGEEMQRAVPNGLCGFCDPDFNAAAAFEEQAA